MDNSDIRNSLKVLLKIKAYNDRCAFKKPHIYDIFSKHNFYFHLGYRNLSPEQKAEFLQHINKTEQEFLESCQFFNYVRSLFPFNLLPPNIQTIYKQNNIFQFIVMVDSNYIEKIIDWVVQNISIDDYNQHKNDPIILSNYNDPSQPEQPVKFIGIRSLQDLESILNGKPSTTTNSHIVTPNHSNRGGLAIRKQK